MARSLQHIYSGVGFQELIAWAHAEVDRIREEKGLPKYNWQVRKVLRMPGTLKDKKLCATPGCLIKLNRNNRMYCRPCEKVRAMIKVKAIGATNAS